MIRNQTFPSNKNIVVYSCGLRAGTIQECDCTRKEAASNPTYLALIKAFMDLLAIMLPSRGQMRSSLAAYISVITYIEECPRPQGFLFPLCGILWLTIKVAITRWKFFFMDCIDFSNEYIHQPSYN
jgi:hypothetical protein